MLVSLCIPCRNRTHDLKEVMPTFIATANASPPVEICVLNYNTQDDLADWMGLLMENTPLEGGSQFRYMAYWGRDRYHMAHARNLSVAMSYGEYITICSADIAPKPAYMQAVRERIAEGAVWMQPRKYRGIMVLRREEFFEAGGFDERFEFYGKEDIDLEDRLKRRGLMPVQVPTALHVIKTPNSIKSKGYRLDISKAAMNRRARPIYLDNCEKGVLVANEGQEWGQW